MANARGASVVGGWSQTKLINLLHNVQQNDAALRSSHATDITSNDLWASDLLPVDSPQPQPCEYQSHAPCNAPCNPFVDTFALEDEMSRGLGGLNMGCKVDSSATLSTMTQDSECGIQSIDSIWGDVPSYESWVPYRDASLNACEPLPAEAVPDDTQNAGLLSGDTTLMIRGIPCSFTQETLMEVLDNAGFAGTYTFLYMPRFETNLGYSFVNFRDGIYAQQCYYTFHGVMLKPDTSQKTCTISRAHIQGLAKLKKVFRKKRGHGPFFIE